MKSIKWAPRHLGCWDLFTWQKQVPAEPMDSIDITWQKQVPAEPMKSMGSAGTCFCHVNRSLQNQWFHWFCRDLFLSCKQVPAEPMKSIGSAGTCLHDRNRSLQNQWIPLILHDRNRSQQNQWISLVLQGPVYMTETGPSRTNGFYWYYMTETGPCRTNDFIGSAGTCFCHVNRFMQNQWNPLVLLGRVSVM